MLTAASQVSPRIGVAYEWPSSQTAIRASFGRFFQPPQPENLLLASSEQARHLSPFVTTKAPAALRSIPNVRRRSKSP
jgi:hypothetical protein